MCRIPPISPLCGDMDISGGSESLFRGYGRSPVPGRMRPPFSFFLKKRMRRARWKRKSLFAAQPALRASWRKCGGLPNRCRPDLPAFCRVRSTLAVVDAAPPQLAEPRQSSWGGRPQGWSSLPRAFRFAMRCPGSPGRRVPSPQQPPRCVSKREAGGIRERLLPPISRNCQCAAAIEEQKGLRNFPQLPNPPYTVEWSRPSVTTKPKPP